MQTQTVDRVGRFVLNLIHWFRLATYGVLFPLTIDEGQGDDHILLWF
jgi:hypothetical protein